MKDIIDKYLTGRINYSIINYEKLETIMDRYRTDSISLIKERNISIEHNLLIELKDDLLEFYQTLISKLGNVNLTLLNNNFGNLVLSKQGSWNKEDSKCISNSNVTALIYDNRIVLRNNYDKSVLFHELLHAASKFNNNEGGFLIRVNDHLLRSPLSYNYVPLKERILCRLKGKKMEGIPNGYTIHRIGEGLNEGFTEYLTYKLTGTCNAYFNLVKIIKLLNLVINEDFTTKCYFNADLYSLVKEMLNYTDYENVNDLINYTDSLINELPWFYFNGNMPSKDRAVQDFTTIIYQEITKIIYEMLKNKIKDYDRESKNLLLSKFFEICNEGHSKLGKNENIFEFLSKELLDDLKSEISKENKFTR